MSQETKPTENELTKEEVDFIEESDSTIESLLRSIILGYQQSYNRVPEQKNEIKYSLTITTHKVATPDGNKDVAYLRLDKSVREKGEWPKLVPSSSPDQVEKNWDDGWETKLVHQEVYFFRNLQERLKPGAPWKEQLYVNAIARMVGAGLEYAELLQRLKNTKQTETLPEDETTERAEKIGLTLAKEMPKALSPDELKYKEDIKNLRAQQGIID